MLRLIPHKTFFALQTPETPDETEDVKEKYGQHTDHEEVEGEEHKGDEDVNIQVGNSEEDEGQTRGALEEETLSFQVRGDKENAKNDEAGSCDINVATGAELDSSAHGNTRENVGSAEEAGTDAGVVPVTVDEMLGRRPGRKRHRETKNQTGNEKMNALTVS